MTDSRYLAFLPAVYAERDDGDAQPGFIGAFLAIFEKLLSGIADGELDGRKGIHELLAAEVIGNLFHPRLSFLFDAQQPPDTTFIPPISGAPAPTRTRLLADFNSYIGLAGSPDPLARFVAAGSRRDSEWQAEFEAWLNDFLDWLGGWVALVPDKDWSIDKKRTVIAEIVALHRLRGTPQGMSMLIDLVFDLPLTVDGLSYPVGSTVPEVVHGQVVATVANPAPAPLTVSDLPATAFILRDRWRAGDPVVAGRRPWLFEVTLTLPNAGRPDFILTLAGIQQVTTLATGIRALLESARPAASHATLAIVPGLLLSLPAWASQLGVNTLIGEQGPL